MTARKIEESPADTSLHGTKTHSRYNLLGQAGAGLIGLGTGVVVNDLSTYGPRLAAASIMLGFVLHLASRLRSRPVSHLHSLVIWTSAAAAIAASCGVGFGPNAWRPYFTGAMVVLALIVAVLPRNTVWAMTMLVLIFAVAGGSVNALSRQHAVDALAQDQAWIKIPGTVFVLVLFLILPLYFTVRSKVVLASALLLGGICSIAIGVGYGIRHDYIRALASAGTGTGGIITGCVWLKDSLVHGWLNQAWIWLTKERPEKLLS